MRSKDCRSMLWKDRNHLHRRKPMKRTIFACTASFLAITALIAKTAFAAVVTYPAPAGAPMSAIYRIFANGQPVAAYQAQSGWNGGAYSVAYFDFSDSVTVKVTPGTSFKILPRSYGIVSRIVGDTLVFVLTMPRNISIEAAGKTALLLFANAIETDAPHSGDANVIFRGPGLYTENISVTSNQTLYLAGGAYVKGRISASGSNITIRGRGIVDGTDGNGGNISMQNCSNIRLKDIIFKGSGGWCVVPRYSDSVSIVNVKVCDGRNLGDDALDVVNCTKVLIKGCFLRSADDCIAIKGYIHSTRETATNDKPCAGILVEDCVLWTEDCNIFRIGFESEVSGSMSDYTARNCDVIRSGGQMGCNDYWRAGVFYLQPTDNTPMENLLFENFRIEPEAPCNVLRCSPMIRSGWGWNGIENGKYVKNVVFRDIEYKGSSSAPICLYGVDATHYVSDISLIRVKRGGVCAQRTSPGVTVGPSATNITFDCSATGAVAPRRSQPSRKVPLIIQHGAHMAVFNERGARVGTAQGEGIDNSALPAGIYYVKRGEGTAARYVRTR